MNVYEIFKDQKVCISPLHNKEYSYHIRPIAGCNTGRLKDICEYYFKDVKRLKNGSYNVTRVFGDFEETDCTRICVEDTPSLLSEQVELEEGYCGEQTLIAVYNFDDVYNDCDCYEDGWQLEYFKEHITGCSMDMHLPAEYNKQYTFELCFEVVRVYNLIDGKIHVEIKVEVS